MADSYTVFWTMDRWLAAVAVGHKPLPVLFGGPHLSEPSFRRAGVRVGDLIYPVAVSNRRVHLVARMRVREMILLGQEDGPTLIEERFPQYRAWKFLAPTCTEEVVVGMEGTAPRADLELPPDMLSRLMFRSQKGERPLKHLKNGELTSSIGLQGIYRLAPASATDLAELIESPAPAASPRIPRPTGRVDRRTMLAPEDALF
ncbi:MAG TPA: hypothetical protein VF163_05770 [Micromonosporaceae bacterium]